MKNSIKLFSAFILLAAFSFNVGAQQLADRSTKDRPSPTERANKQTTKMVEELNLNTSQATLVSSINLEYANKMKALHETNKDDREAMKQAKMELKTAKKAELSRVLTTAQLTQYEASHANKKKGKACEGKKACKGSKNGKKA